MIDTLIENIDRIKQPSLWNKYQLKEKGYLLLTLHRPSNVDDHGKFYTILQSLIAILQGYKIVFPVYQRTLINFKNIDRSYESLICSEPVSYLEFMYLLKNAKGVVTDSCGITEEATVLKIPCITLRNTTERPETVSEGTNNLVGDDLRLLKSCLTDLKNRIWKTGNTPKLWDRNTSGRIVLHLKTIYGVNTVGSRLKLEQK
jgi:UDP-N-acetylglucosamine 2-epimerase (non-hydrolysing)